LTQRLSPVLLQDIVSQEQGMRERDGRGQTDGETERDERQQGEKSGGTTERGKEIFFQERSEGVT